MDFRPGNCTAPPGERTHETPLLQVFQGSDRLASGVEANVCTIDPFDGKPWSLERFPPKPEDDFMGWIHSIGGLREC